MTCQSQDTHNKILTDVTPYKYVLKDKDKDQHVLIVASVSWTVNMITGVPILSCIGYMLTPENLEIETIQNKCIAEGYYPAGICGVGTLRFQDWIVDIFTLEGAPARHSYYELESISLHI